MSTLPDLSSMEQWTLLLMGGLTCLWFFGLGTAFGSFLNVVVYRMPLGLPVGGRSSHCPGCRRLIPWYDNVPILGYLRLRGHCQCREHSISPRYPLVETTVGILFITLLMVELLSGGANLPLRRPNGSIGVVWIIWSLQWDLIGTYLYHLTLLYVLFGLTLIDLDGFRPPPRWVGFGLTVGLLAPLVAPFVQLVPIGGVAPGTIAETFSVSDAMSRAGVGLLGGAALGIILSLPWRDERRSHSSAHLVAALALAGAYLGWQSALSIALASAFALIILRRAETDEPALGTVPRSMIVWVATLMHIMTWRFTTNLGAWPGPSAGTPALVSAVIILIGLTILTRSIPRSTQPTGDRAPALQSPVVLIEIGIPEPVGVADESAPAV